MMIMMRDTNTTGTYHNSPGRVEVGLKGIAAVNAPFAMRALLVLSHCRAELSHVAAGVAAQRSRLARVGPRAQLPVVGGGPVAVSDLQTMPSHAYHNAEYVINQ